MAQWRSFPCPPSCSTASHRTAGTRHHRGLCSSSTASQCSLGYYCLWLLNAPWIDLSKASFYGIITTSVGLLFSGQRKGADPQHLCCSSQCDQCKHSDSRPWWIRRSHAPASYTQHSRIICPLKTLMLLTPLTIMINESLTKYSFIIASQWCTVCLLELQ